MQLRLVRRGASYDPDRRDLLQVCMCFPMFSEKRFPCRPVKSGLCLVQLTPCSVAVRLEILYGSRACVPFFCCVQVR